MNRNIPLWTAALFLALLILCTGTSRILDRIYSSTNIYDHCIKRAMVEPTNNHSGKDILTPIEVAIHIINSKPIKSSYSNTINKIYYSYSNIHSRAPPSLLI